MFNEAEKRVIIDEIERQYFQRNFGSLSKTEWETFLFSVYLSHCRKDDGEAFDDYTMSKKLGLTQSRVRSLKEKALVRFGEDNDSWKEAFVMAIPKASYDKDTHIVKMLIPEKDVIIEVRQMLEEQGLYDERSLNDKLLTIPISSFLEICFALYEQNNAIFSTSAEATLLELQKKYQDEGKTALQRLNEDRTFNGLKTFAMEVGPDVLTEVLEFLGSSVPALQIGKMLLNIAKVIKNSK